jgi:hypothetical protein
MGVGDLLNSARLKLEGFVWEARRVCAAFIAQKRTKAYALFGLAGAGVIALIVVVTIIVLNLHASNTIGAKASGPSALFPAGDIPDEEFFVPGEPDFLPPVILYREPKERWTDEDAAPFWTDPATLDDWSNKVEKYVDNLLEGVP